MNQKRVQNGGVRCIQVVPINHRNAGEVASRTGTTQTPFQHGGTQGYYQDNSGRTYVRQRVLRTTHGRWMTQDPISFSSGDFNLYRYVNNDPINTNDASGLKPNCTPVAYMCYRDIKIGNHAFFWVHYPCSPNNDRYFGYGPGGYEKPGQLQADREGVAGENGYVNCHRTDCKVSCVVKLGSMIGQKGNEWEPSRYIVHFHDCKTFRDQVLEDCDCSYWFHGFVPHPRPKPKKK